MASLVKDLVEAGIHFGHRTTNWNPKMAPYIFDKKNKIHIIDIKATIKGLLLARKFVTRTIAGGKDVLFVGTKRQARACIEKYVKDTQMPWVTERWLGGTLTNFRTIRERLKRLEELEGLETTGAINSYSKKMESQLRRERKKITRNLEGIRNMEKLPGALVIVDVGREINAIREARKLGIPTVCLIDTDGDPDLADIAIPGNDDSMRSIDVVIRELCEAIVEGKNQRVTVKEDASRDDSAEARAGDAQAPRRRSRRAMFRSEDEGGSRSPEAASEGDQTPRGGAPAKDGQPVAAQGKDS